MSFEKGVSMEVGGGGSSRRTPPNPALPYREDCWSEGETSALIDAWGHRYVELNRGNLRQQHWQEVADAVNSRHGAAASRRPPRTDVQCKNRIDTLKKKYKIEKARILESGGAAESQWQFYSRLDALVGPTTPAAALKMKPATATVTATSPPLALPLPYHRNGSPLPTAAAIAAVPVKDKRPRMVLPSNNRDPSFQKNYSALAAAAAAAAVKDSDSGSEPSSRSSREKVKLKRWREMKDEEEEEERDGGDGMKELAHAIQRFAEIYERVEEAKQKQIMEIEKQRMEFAKALEFERMQIFVDSQIQLEKIKRVKLKDAGEILFTNDNCES